VCVVVDLKVTLVYCITHKANLYVFKVSKERDVCINDESLIIIIYTRCEGYCTQKNAPEVTRGKVQ